MEPRTAEALQSPAVGGIVAFVLLAFAAGAADAQAPIGLSSVRGQFLANENLLFFVPEADDHFGAAFATGDFNGDGVADLATGAPDDNGLAGFELPNAGIVVVRYGVAGAGLESGLADTVLSLWNSGSPAQPAVSARLGQALAAGDFNADGIDDLAIGVPQDIGAGSVLIHYGLPGGIAFAAEHYLHPGLDGVPGSNFETGLFGSALAVGDFDADGHDDLAVGAPLHDHGCGTLPCLDAEGFVVVFHGHVGGLVPFSGYEIDQDSPGIHDFVEVDDHFGAALAAGDFDASGHDDLAIGIPGESQVGAVQVLYGSGSGLLFDYNLIRTEGDVGGVSEAFDDFGGSLASGDFDGDGRDDLAIGARLEDLGSANAIENAGEVTVLYGSSWPEGFNPAKTDRVTQGVLYGAAADEFADFFGSALAAGDFDGDGVDDLVVGQYGEDLGAGNFNLGGLTVLMGGPAGAGARYRFLAMGSAGVPGDYGGEVGQAFGTGDFDDDGYDDLALGSPTRRTNFDEIPPFLDGVGGAAVLYGGMFGDGFEGANTWSWSAWVP